MLRPDTAQLWAFLKDEPALRGFVLVGGSALALHLDHRLSEDLDFICLEQKLPHAQLSVLQRRMAERGFSQVAADDPLAAEEFEIAGMDLRDYQQDFLVNGTVRLTFFTADEAMARLLAPGSVDRPRLAGIPELFALKAILAADRSKTRDWYDLYILMSREGFSFADFHQVFEKAGVQTKFALALRRLCGGSPSRNDEGFQALLANPPSVEKMTAFFQAARDEWEIAAARAAKAGK